MGSAASQLKTSMTTTMEENAKRMQETQREMMLKQRELQLAMQLAAAKDLLNWWATFTATVAGMGLVAALKFKKPGPLIPLLPLSFVCAFQYDLVYGNKLERNRMEAERLLQEERHKLRFYPPQGNLLISYAQYAEIFQDQKRSE